MSRKPPTGVSDEGHSPYEDEFRAIGRLLEKNATQIMERWFERAGKEQMHAQPHQREKAMNELHEMLESLGQRLRKQSNHALAVASQLAREHGEQRFDLGWNIVDLVRDYEILHGVALEHLEEVHGERLTYRQAMVIATIMNGAIGHAVHAYSTLTQKRIEEQIEQQKAELRQLTLDLTDAEHHERQRIASLLHDDFQQILVATKMKLAVAFGKAAPDLAAAEEAKGMLDQAIRISRNVAQELHPMVLESQGLPAAVERLSETFQQQYGMTVTVELNVPPDCDRIPMSLRRLVYDSVRELLFNVVKHAHTSKAWVRISCDEQWRIEVEDRGTGVPEMATTAPPGGRSFGIGSIRHRMKQIGGTLDIFSEPNKGTRAILTFPL